MKSIQQGIRTGQFGSRLASRVRGDPSLNGWVVFYDHGDRSLDAAVAATKGFFGSEVKNLNRLADIDVLVASPDEVAAILIEIEERAASPKKVLGDVLAILLCNRFAVRAMGVQRAFRVSPETRLVVAGLVPDRGNRLRKIEQVIGPRLQQLAGLPDGISPKNVHLVFSATIDATLTKLEILLASWLPSGTD